MRVVVVGAGIGGLAAAVALAARGADVTVLEQAEAPGGKMRDLPTAAGPAAAGPTVFTMKPVFDALCAAADARLEDWVTLHREHLLARHYWLEEAGGGALDLTGDLGENVAAVRALSGAQEAARFERFCARARRLYDSFEAPMMRAPAPDLAGIARAALRGGAALAPYLTPWATLARRLSAELRDPRLRQLFGRYATYVGGSPFKAPAVLALIWEAEARGVWRIEGGMSALARGLAGLAEARGARFTFGCAVEAIETNGPRGAVTGVRLADGAQAPADVVVFNGDPAALRAGLLGEAARRAVGPAAVGPRSLSAFVWSFAARPEPIGGRDISLAHHTVLFGARQRDEFDALAAGRIPTDPTLYICAQDRVADRVNSAARPDGLERFEIIMNGPPRPAEDGRSPEAAQRERDACAKITFETLSRHGLRFPPEPRPEPTALTTPSGFAARFPGSSGSLYGRSPHGLMASFLRPTARSRLPGLYLAGGGAHPGAGVPMAALSGAHAAETIWRDRTSRSAPRPTATPGGISTGSATTDAAPSR
ncbi:MAG: 1-hydroxycarotenoid 3,4-desaturase CrtD [Pseudomonadota bacterium]